MKAFQAYSSGGFRHTASTPRAAALGFFAAFPNKRKCDVTEGESANGFFTVTLGDKSRKRWHEVTKQTAPNLPDTQ